MVQEKVRPVMALHTGSRTCYPEHRTVHISHIAVLVVDLVGRTMQLVGELLADLLLE